MCVLSHSHNSVVCIWHTMAFTYLLWHTSLSCWYRAKVCWFEEKPASSWFPRKYFMLRLHKRWAFRCVMHLQQSSGGCVPDLVQVIHWFNVHRCNTFSNTASLIQHPTRITTAMCRHQPSMSVGADGREQISKAELRLTDIADTLQGDWVVLARLLYITDEEITKIQMEYTYVSEQALVMLHLWVQKSGGKATGGRHSDCCNSGGTAITGTATLVVAFLWHYQLTSLFNHNRFYSVINKLQHLYISKSL